MNKIILLLVSISVLSCATPRFTHRKFFNCSGHSGFNLDTDKRQLIYAILNKALITKKDIPDYILITDKTKIYIRDEWSSFEFGGMEEPKFYPLNTSDIPSKINGIQFCVKSISELQEIADATNDFWYLTFLNIEIGENTAQIGLTNYPMMSTKNKEKYISLAGGGYVLEFKKINGRWEFVKMNLSFIS